MCLAMSDPHSGPMVRVCSQASKEQKEFLNVYDACDFTCLVMLKQRKCDTCHTMMQFLTKCNAKN